MEFNKPLEHDLGELDIVKWYTEAQDMLEELLDDASVPANADTEVKLISIDFSQWVVEVLRSSWLQTLGNQLISHPSYINHINHKCYLIAVQHNLNTLMILKWMHAHYSNRFISVN